MSEENAMLPNATLPHAGYGSHADLPDRLLSVVAELTEVMQEENAALALGLPAALSTGIDRKLELSECYEDLYAEWADTQAELLSADPAFAHKLMAAVLLLRETTAENLTRLDAALTASRRRVEAVMAAVRSEARENAPYNARGDVPLNARLAAFGKDYHA